MMQVKGQSKERAHQKCPYFSLYHLSILVNYSIFFLRIKLDSKLSTYTHFSQFTICSVSSSAATLFLLDAH